MNDENLLAAIDLGSNSFRLSVGRVVKTEGEPQVYATDKIKEMVRLASGLDKNNVLSEEAQERAIATLKRFGERIAHFNPTRVRCVATNTFRVATNIDEFKPRAEHALGFPIDIISGQEEARLIYLGVVHELPPAEYKRLVVDIGGGSTEFIIGEGLNVRLAQSLPMGCVSYTQRYFNKKGKLSAQQFAMAELAASQALEGIKKHYRELGWDEAFGSSGTAKSLIAILAETGLNRHGMSLVSLMKLRDLILERGTVDNLPGLTPDRMPVLPAGLAIMIALFKALRIEQMSQGDGALRLGVMYDMVGRQTQNDQRDQTVRAMLDRLHLSLHQAQRVESQALALFDQVVKEDTLESRKTRQWLGWAAQLHEIGLSIAQGGYHRHGAYIVEHADMPGFGKISQNKLSLYVLAHQGGLNKIADRPLTDLDINAILCLRLAVLFCRKRKPLTTSVRLRCKGKTYTLMMDEQWLDRHDLTRYSLKEEAKIWKQLGYSLVIKPVVMA